MQEHSFFSAPSPAFIVCRLFDDACSDWCVFLPGKFHGQRSLAGYSLLSCKRAGHDWAAKQHQQSGSWIGEETGQKHGGSGGASQTGWNALSPVLLALLHNIHLINWFIVPQSTVLGGLASEKVCSLTSETNGLWARMLSLFTNTPKKFGVISFWIWDSLTLLVVQCWKLPKRMCFYIINYCVIFFVCVSLLSSIGM